MPLLDELVGMGGERRTERVGERFRTRQLTRNKEA
jgi:hypothetical protein